MRQTGIRGKAVLRDKAAARGDRSPGQRSGAKPAGSSANGIHAALKPSSGPATINRPLNAKAAPGSFASAPRSTSESLEQSVFRSLEQYFANLDGAKPHALHEMVLGAIEKPLLQFALHRCEGNQSAAADLLGINRNTLRRKLQDYGLH